MCCIHLAMGLSGKMFGQVGRTPTCSTFPTKSLRKTNQTMSCQLIIIERDSGLSVAVFTGLYISNGLVN